MIVLLEVHEPLCLSVEVPKTRLRPPSMMPTRGRGLRGKEACFGMPGIGWKYVLPLLWSFRIQRSRSRVYAGTSSGTMATEVASSFRKRTS